MTQVRVLTVALAATLIAGTIGAESGWAAPMRGRRIYSYRPQAPASGVARVQSNRRYSYAPGAAGGSGSTSNNGGAAGLRSAYRMGSGYAPRQGIRPATWKVQGL